MTFHVYLAEKSENILSIQNSETMKILFLSVMSLVSGAPVKDPDIRNPTLASLPEKLRLYQNATGISDDSILAIFKKSLEGEFYRIVLLVQHAF